MIETPYFGIVLSLAAYIAGIKLNRLSGGNPFVNPLALACIFCIAFMLAFDIPLEAYMLGGNYILFLIAPATVALVINLYKNIDLLKKNWIAIIIGISIGSFIHFISVILLCRIFGLGATETISMTTKSLTAAISVSLTEEYGGIVTITVIMVISQGIIGAIIAQPLYKLLNIEDPVAQGVGMGTAAHAVGTAKALELGEVQGAMSGLSIAVTGFISVVALPFLIRTFL